MAEGLTLETALPPDGIAAVEALGSVEALVVVTALNQARTAPAAVAAAAAGLARGFAGRKAAVLFVDGGSQDGSVEAVRDHAVMGSPVPVASAWIAGRPGRGRAVVAALAAARHVGVRAVGLVDAGLSSFADEWVEPLLGPVLGGDADYVSPAYTRAVTEGTLTTNLLAPLVRALFGKRLQEVLGGCAAVSSTLLESLAPAEDWADEPSGQGAEMRLLGQALAGDYALVEVHLGRKQIDPGAGPPIWPTPSSIRSVRSSGSWSATRARGRMSAAARRSRGETVAAPARRRPATFRPTAWSGPSISA